jgi:MGT family glycosyltransferase
MSTIAFVEMPASGHVNPSLPIVRELVRRGERVVYFTDVEFEATVERTGAEFRPYPRGVLTSRMIANATQTGDLTRVPTVILRATETLLPFLRSELATLVPSAVVLDSNALWGHAAVRQLRLFSVSLMTTFMLSGSVYRALRPREWRHAIVPALPGVPRVIAARSHLVRRFGAAAFPRPAFPARGDLNLALFPRELQPDSAGIDETFCFVGPMIDPTTRSASGLPFSLTGAPLVYISLGTLHRGSLDFFRCCFAAFGGMPAQVVLAVGAAIDVAALGTPPPNFVVLPTVPQLDVLQHASAFVTHGGMNSGLEGLWWGVPLIVIPQHLEQLAIGLHVAARGAGVVLRRHAAGQRVRVGDLRQALEPVLAEPRFRAAAQAEQATLHQYGGYRQAADEIQAVLSRRP